MEPTIIENKNSPFNSYASQKELNESYETRKILIPFVNKRVQITGAVKHYTVVSRNELGGYDNYKLYLSDVTVIAGRKKNILPTNIEHLNVVVSVHDHQKNKMIDFFDNNDLITIEGPVIKYKTRHSINAILLKLENKDTLIKPEISYGVKAGKILYETMGREDLKIED